MRYALLSGRIFFSLIFILSGLNHFKAATIAYGAAAGVPLAPVLVPLSGVLACVGGLMIALGYRARVGGLLIAAFLIPATLSMHAFWALDGAERSLQQVMFMKNLSMLGGALVIAYFGSGPLSLDARRVPRERLETQEDRERRKALAASGAGGYYTY